MRKMRVTLEIDVADLPDDERAEYEEQQAEFIDDDEEEYKLPTVAEYDAVEIADILQHDNPDAWIEFFAGSDVYVKFDETKVVSAEWLDA